MRVLGIDPGLQTTGYGVLETSPHGIRLVEAGVVRSAARGTLAGRVREIHEGVADVLRSLGPAVMAIEKLYSHYDRPVTAILMGHARGAIILAAALADVPVADYPATRVKKTLTGSGRAGKGQVQAAIQRELRLARFPDPPDVADALAIALCHCHAQRTPLR